MAIDLPPASYIRLDLFPATVKGVIIADGIQSNTRLIVTDAYIVILIDSHTGPVPILVEELGEFSGTPVIGYSITTADNDVIEARRSSSCGCGSKLRGLRPYPNIPYISRTQ